MTTNQIIIPIVTIGLAVFVAFFVIRAKRLAKANAQRDHRPHSGSTLDDPKDIARSIGHSGNGGDFS